MDRYIGKLLDNRYEILEKIGSGGMADVYKARCHRLNRLVAIKILKEDLSQDAEFRRRFHAESQAVAMLSHPNIVSVYDVSHSDNIDYIVMELIEGITLKQYMEQKGTLNWREALHFATQICKALEHAHSRGIIHRDIKPENINLPSGTVKDDEIAAHCAAYEQKIKDCGGIDLQILGIGRTGHIGFNEPGSDDTTITRQVHLDELTRSDAAPAFGGIENVPTTAITMGVATIMGAREVALMAWGEKKASIVKKAVQGPVTVEVAASYLQKHPNAKFLLDKGAASLL